MKINCFLVACEVDGIVETDAEELSKMWAFKDQGSAQKFADQKNKDYAQKYFLEYDSNNIPRVWTVGEGAIERDA